MNKHISDIHERAVRVATQYKKCEAELILILQEMQECRGYLDYNASSIYEYCLIVLKLSEPISASLRSVVYKSREVPALQEAIVSGELTLSKAHKIVSVINKDNQDQWLEIAATKTSREIEKAVATANPQAAIQERVRYRSEDRIELTIGISEEVLKKFERVMDLESQRTSKPASKEEALNAALEIYLEKNDPVRKAARLQAKDKVNKPIEKPKTFPGTFSKSNSRKALSAPLIRAMDRRDQGQCTHLYSDGSRCKNKRWIERHHIVPKAFGGDDSLENLTTLCSMHHKSLHRPSMRIR